MPNQTQNLKTLRKILAAFLVLTLGSFSIPFAHADTFTPFQKTFRISAYYSPLPDQAVYFRGSYDADRRLNGNGTHGADGTPVYVGMLAAPKSYAFGTKLAIPGLGVGAIHDRGGAIVNAGERGNSFDRIDVWMGAGEEGLARALQWGMRTVTATIYPTTHEIAESFDLPNYQKKIVAEIKLGETKDDIKMLQTELKTYGYYRGEITGTFDDATKTALAEFQVARRLIGSLDDSNAGIFGPKTRELLNREIAQRTLPTANLLASSVLQTGAAGNKTSTQAKTDARFPVSLSLGDRGDRVRELQIALTKIGAYECEVNGIFDAQTAACLAQFQIEEKILGTTTSYGAGHFGPKTKTVFNERLRAKLLALPSLPENPTLALIPETYAPKFYRDLTLGDAGAEVTELQRTLVELEYLTTVSDKYDTATLTAVTKFQLANQIIKSETELGAGVLGPKTRNALNATIAREKIALIKTVGKES